MTSRCAPPVAERDGGARTVAVASARTAGTARRRPAAVLAVVLTLSLPRPLTADESPRNIAPRGWHPTFCRIEGKDALIFWSESEFHPKGEELYPQPYFVSTASRLDLGNPMGPIQPLLQIRQWDEPWGQFALEPHTSGNVLRWFFQRYGYQGGSVQVESFEPDWPPSQFPIRDKQFGSHVGPGKILLHFNQTIYSGYVSCQWSWLSTDQGGPALLFVRADMETILDDLRKVWNEGRSGQMYKGTWLSQGAGSTPSACRSPKGELILARAAPGGVPHESAEGPSGRISYSWPTDRREKCRLRYGFPRLIEGWKAPYWPCGWNQGPIVLSRGPTLEGITDSVRILGGWRARTLRLVAAADGSLWLLLIQGPESWETAGQIREKLPVTADFVAALSVSWDDGKTWQEPRVLLKTHCDDLMGDVLVRDKDLLFAYSALSPEGKTGVWVSTIDRKGWPDARAAVHPPAGGANPGSGAETGGK